jgi:hypothetical protein
MFQLREFCLTLQDRWDIRRAVSRRDRLGRRRWLVNWQRRPDGWWLARVSCPRVPITIERAGPTRCQAIRRAAEALALLASDD